MQKMPFCNAIYALLQRKRAPLTFQRGKVITTNYKQSILKRKTNKTLKTSLNYGNNLLMISFLPHGHNDPHAHKPLKRTVSQRKDNKNRNKYQRNHRIKDAFFMAFDNSVGHRLE